jgi:hypothetical protein
MKLKIYDYPYEITQKLIYNYRYEITQKINEVVESLKNDINEEKTKHNELIDKLEYNNAKQHLVNASRLEEFQWSLRKLLINKVF